MHVTRSQRREADACCEPSPSLLALRVPTANPCYVHERLQVQLLPGRMWENEFVLRMMRS